MLSALALAAVGFLLMPAAAFASPPDYPAPSVDPAVQTGAPLVQADPGIALASNSGSDLTIGMPLVVAAVALVVGVALLVMMTRPSKGKHHRR